jgi:predicted nucleotidyltransferase
MEGARNESMNLEPRQRGDYSDRQVEAAHRVLVDLGQVLKQFQDRLVVVGGWIPDLLLPEADEPHIGSIDVDLALDAEKLAEGQYAELLKVLLNTRRYKQAEEPFRFFAEVDLEDGLQPIRVDVDFLKSPAAKTKKNKPKLTKNFRPLDARGCDAAFENPELVIITGKMIKGQTNKVQFRVASIADFLIMKSYALANRDKPKDAYDICYCLDNYPGGVQELAANWKKRKGEKHVIKAIEIWKEKFASVNSYGPVQVLEFYNSPNPIEREQQARRAFELVLDFLKQAQ